MLFLVYINDIVIDTGSNIRLFADDTSLYITVDDPVAAAGCLNTDLQKITRWAATWLVSFNPTKTEAFLVSRKLIRNHPSIYMQNQQNTEVESHVKHLGIYFTNDCTWHHHIKNITDKAWTTCRINCMRKLKFRLARNSLETIYLTFIRPLLEYGDVLWDNCTQKHELDKIQNEAARIATGATKLISLHALSNEVKWESLEERRRKHKLTLFFIK